MNCHGCPALMRCSLLLAMAQTRWDGGKPTYECDIDCEKRDLKDTCTLGFTNERDVAIRLLDMGKRQASDFAPWNIIIG